MQLSLSEEELGDSSEEEEYPVESVEEMSWVAALTRRRRNRDRNRCQMTEHPQLSCCSGKEEEELGGKEEEELGDSVIFVLLGALVVTLAT